LPIAQLDVLFAFLHFRFSSASFTGESVKHLGSESRTNVTMKRRCPACYKIIEVSVRQRPEQEGYHPFCSERCKLVDLGDWLDVKYRIISELKSENSGGADSSSDITNSKR
jgi:endogenous inhibitor of DNA gyrase (YacG/DUF329 family)